MGLKELGGLSSLRSILSSVSNHLSGINANANTNGIQKTSILDRFKMNFSAGSSTTQSASNRALNTLAEQIDQDGSKSDNIRTQNRIIRVDDGKTQLSYDKLNREVVKETLKIHGIKPSNVEMEELMALPGMNKNDLNGKDTLGLMKQAKVLTDDKGKILKDSSGREIFGYQFPISPKFQRAILADYANVKADLAANPNKKAVIDMSKGERIAETVKIAYEKGYISREVKDQLGNISSTELGVAFGTGGAIGIIAEMEGAGAVLGPAGTVATSLYVTKQAADFEGIVKGVDRATSRAELDKPAREFGQWMGRLSKDGVLAIVGAAGAKVAPRVMPAPTAKVEQAITNTARGVKEVLTEQPTALGQPKLSPANNAPIEELNVQTPKTGRLPFEETNAPLERRAKIGENGRRDVQSHEQAATNSKGGHTLERHVGKSENWLRNRLKNDPTLEEGFASSFTNEQAANRVQGRVVNRYKDKIDSWLENPSGKPLKLDIDMNEPIGIVVEKGKASSTTATKARVILVKDDSQQGWHYLTSFPIK